MGFSVRDVNIIYWLKNNRLINAGDAVIELGSQQINNDVIENIEIVDKLAKLFKVAPFSKSFAWGIKEQKYLSSGMQELPKGAPLAREFYEHLGLKYACIDIDDDPRAIKMDLNFDSIPENYKGRYRLVTNLGTTEHVINQFNAFKIIHELTAVNGFMVHTLPFQGFAAHGLVNYTMKFFWLLCRSNMYRVIDSDISACQKVPIPASIVDFIKNNGNIFGDKGHVGNIELQDSGVTVILQKLYNIDFVPPIDIPNGAIINDSRIKRKYWTELDRGSIRMKLLRGKRLLKNIGTLTYEAYFKSALRIK